MAKGCAPPETRIEESMLLKAKVLAFWTLYEEHEGIVEVVECDSSDERSSLVGNVNEPVVTG